MQQDFICVDDSACSDLVNPDNSLTQQGEHVKGCIQNGAVLVGGALLLGFPPTAILSTLPMIAQLGGCGDVINFGTVNLGQLKHLGNLVG